MAMTETRSIITTTTTAADSGGIEFSNPIRQSSITTVNTSTSSSSKSNSNSNSNSNLNASSSSSSSSSPSMVTTLKVLTLNCWGLWLGAKRRRQRMNGIVRYLKENNCDVVFLQEVWVTTDFEFIKNETKDLYCFAHLFRSGSVIGSSGIVILCKWYPKVIHFEPYSLNGSPFYPWHGDWFAGKGIAYARVEFESLSLHLFSTHTHAYYSEDEPLHDQYSVHRVCQSYQLAKFINFICDTACNRSPDNSVKDLIVVAGDMNSTSSELPYKILTTMGGLTDCNDSDTEEHEHITYCHPKNSFTPGTALLRSIQQKKLGATNTSSNNNNNNTSNKKYKISPRHRSPMKRIDFILCRLLNHGHCIADKIVTESKDRTINCSLSDHEPVMVEFKICDIKDEVEQQRTNLLKGGVTTGSIISRINISTSDNNNSGFSSGNINNNNNNNFLINGDDNNLIGDEDSIEHEHKDESNCKNQVLDETRDILKQYYQYNRSSKTQLLYIIFFLFVITLPTVTYYTIINELLPISTIVFMWFAASFIFGIGLLVGFLNYRFEQGAIEAILNDMKVREKAWNLTNIPNIALKQQ